MEEEQEQLEFLKTRATVYQRHNDLELTDSLTTVRKTKRNANFMLCRNHCPTGKEKIAWDNSIHGACNSCMKFEMREHLPNGVLPKSKVVLEYLISLRLQNDGIHGYNSFRETSISLVLHWIFCNIYPLTINGVSKKIESMFTEYKFLKNYVNAKKGEKYWNRYEVFTKQQNDLFDIISSDERKKVQEKLWGVKMTNDDFEFYENQKKTPQIGYCDNFVDRKWNLSKMKKLNRERRVRNEYMDFPISTQSQDIDDGDESDHFDNDKEYAISPEQKRAKYEYVKVFSDEVDDNLPSQYRHIRLSQRSVRPEVYTLMHKLKSTYHMSQRQCEGAIIEVANNLFGRKWKFYDKELPTDADTLPAGSNTRRTESYIEAMALSAIVEEIVEGGDATVMYANDGSGMNGVGNYVVQSLTVNGVQRVLPTFGIFTESRDSLKNLEKSTLRILCASTGYKYNEKQILEHIDFVMTDSTSHNLTVMESVCNEFDAEIPKSLTCNIHPLMMIQRKMNDVYQLLHDTLGKEKIVDCFLVDVDFARENFVIKAIKCLTSFINKDFSAKPWNRQKHFDGFIKPKINETKSFKDQRFNRIFECCTTLVHHLDDIAEYLETYKNIINGISILDRSFVQMALLKPIFCATALIGIHITNPFLILLKIKTTNYSGLLTALPLLYEELCNVSPKSLLTTEAHIFKFVKNDLFKLSLPKKCIRDSLEACIQEYPDEISDLLSLMLSRIADGLSIQKGALFGFGEHANDSTGTLFKICSATPEELIKLNKTSITNLGEERSVGSINYEISIRGRKNLEAASKKLILNKSFDLIEKKLDEGTSLNSYVKPARDIKAIKKAWENEMKNDEANGNQKKDLVNRHYEAVKLTDLEYLKLNGGPFTTPEEVEEFMKKTKESKEKNKRLYTEVRYAKNTCMSLKHSASVFRLKRSYKNLDSNEYADNLKQYFGDTRNKSMLTMNDLTSVLRKITDSQHDDDLSDSLCAKQKDDSIIDELIIGSHVAAFWIEYDKIEWYIGVVEKLVDENSVLVTYFKRVKPDADYEWQPTEEQHITMRDQILLANISVSYNCTNRIRCSITKDAVKEINQLF